MIDALSYPLALPIGSILGGLVAAFCAGFALGDELRRRHVKRILGPKVEEIVDLARPIFRSSGVSPAIDQRPPPPLPPVERHGPKRNPPIVKG